MSMEKWSVFMLSISSILMLSFLYSWSSSIYEMIHVVLLCFLLPTVEVLNKVHGKETEYSMLLILVVTGLMVVSGMCISMFWQNPLTKKQSTPYPSLSFFGSLMCLAWESGSMLYPSLPLQDLGIPPLSGGSPLWVWGVGMFMILLLFVILISWVIREKGGSLRRGMNI
nr:NADH dehydrogenase subunit 6 [Laemobothrion sp.]